MVAVPYPHQFPSNHMETQIKPNSTKKIQHSKKQHVIISLSDLDWALSQNPTVYKLWGECWRNDPYGSRWMPLSTSLKKDSLKKAKKVLREAGLFDFKTEMKILENKRYYETLVINLHGARTSYWQKAELNDNTQVGIESPQVGTENPQVGTENPQVGTENPQVGTDNPPQQPSNDAKSSTPESLNISSGSISGSISDPPYIPPKGTGGEKTFDNNTRNNEEHASRNSSATLTSLSDCLDKTFDPGQEQPPRSENISQSQQRKTTENNGDIPQELKNKLEELEIPLDAVVRRAITNHHISQAYGAVAHIENTWESINNPRGVFLFQISKQPVEQLGARGKVYYSRDFDGYTLEFLKKRYPRIWREAAAHFGVNLEEESCQ